jgi:HEAT repeat protein
VGQPAFVQESTQVLLELADTEQNVDVLEDVARAFGYRRDPRGVAPLLGWCDHVDQRMRFFVAASLPSCADPHDERATRALVELTNDESGAVRDYALMGLRDLAVDGPEVREAMLRRVRDEDTSAAGEALLGLALLGDERGIGPLTEYLQHPYVPSNHVGSYGLEAATAYADARLLPSLLALETGGPYMSDLTEAVQACSTKTIPRGHPG